MQAEIEVKFINIDVDATREILARASAVCEQPMRDMHRAVYEPDELAARDAFVRVRDEGNKLSLTYKQFEGRHLHSAKEIETTVGSFEAAVQIFEQLGFSPKSLQESRRETWKLDDVEVVIDEWPHLNPYIEIEGASEEAVRNVASKLGFDWETAVFGTVTSVYQLQYPEGDATKLITCPRIAFDQPLPAIIKGSV